MAQLRSRMGELMSFIKVIRFGKDDVSALVLRVDSVVVSHALYYFSRWLKFQVSSAVIQDMANGKIKTEMTGTGGGRWNHREDAKKFANKARRENGKREIREHSKD